MRIINSFSFAVFITFFKFISLLPYNYIVTNFFSEGNDETKGIKIK
ncbi:hypothetical protein DF16_orf03359 [Bacillus thuringiensis serovar kurstaki str. YBT-1520]|uniref:Uncharacterized protein n=1 Tax=Bacillus cereus (strain B4264) TaxID=405532 RepID=B7H8I6_BACC4|nr:hypothetical protein BCB4264_A3096 [Bacillus cereus B4264]AGE78459.1 hypothetical protein HD73_2881 [Bacillus thuringiensis serovar kurstaki str. HD73]AIM31774.1 hypothetical protein DF16_orf03359 [Bacillus thuringiensis serovar kurstaki str. YBT-1520]